MGKSARQRHMNYIHSLGRSLQDMKQELKNRNLTDEEVKEIKADMKLCRGYLEAAKEKLRTGSFERPLAKQIAKSQAERLKAVKEYEERRRRQTEAERDEHDKQVEEAHLQAIEEAKREGKPVPPPPRRRKNSKRKRGMSHLFG